LDLGCGEMNWQKVLKLDNIKSYVGVDIVDSVITKNREIFKNDARFTFYCADIEDFPVQNYDLVICRETLFHLPLKKCSQIINNIKDGHNKFFLTSTHEKGINRNIPIGSFYQINVLQTPFSMGPPYRKIPETLHDNRFLYLYKFD
jgi:hypothetical protein